MIKNLPASEGGTVDTGSVPGLGRSFGVGNSNPLQYSCLGNPMDIRAWWATVHGVTESSTKQNMHTPYHKAPPVIVKKIFQRENGREEPATLWILG